MAERTGITDDDNRRSEAGFSLVEMLVVVLILGILVGLGVPTFLRAQAGSSDAAAKTRARQALLTQKTFYTDRGTWGQASEMQAVEPSLQFADLPAEGPQVLGRVYVRVDGATATLVSRSASGNCYWIRAADTGTAFANTPCADAPADSEFDTSW